MFVWFVENLATILISFALAVVIAVIIVVMIRNKKRGKSSCGSCSGCAMSGSCHPTEDKNNDKK